jgi:hypothetical protein
MGRLAANSTAVEPKNGNSLKDCPFENVIISIPESKIDNKVITTTK